MTADTHLTFCTTGILLRRLSADPLLATVTHVVVDEVHERSLQSDFLLALLKRLVVERRLTGMPPLKVVLMSATIDLDLLSDYFGGVPAMTAEGRTFPVSQVFLEDVYAMTSYRLAEDSPAALRAHHDGSFKRQSEKQAGVNETCNTIAARFLPDENIKRVCNNRTDQTVLCKPLESTDLPPTGSKSLKNGRCQRGVNTMLTMHCK